MIKARKKILHNLFIELVKLQKEIISSNIKLLVILEGRDAAGKDGTIKRIIKHLSPRETDPLKQWKISPIDKEAQKYWKDYSAARNEMLMRTNFKYSPWFVVNADKKNSTHISLITHLLRQLEYNDKDNTLLSENSGLVYPATTGNIKEKLY